MKFYLTSLAIFVSFVTISQTLQINLDGHRLTNKDDFAFFYMPDTAWELLHHLSKKETELYLKDRRARGFNVIQAVMLAENEGLTLPNVNGDLPFTNLRSLNPNEPYYKHVDWILKKAKELRLYIAVLPVLGQYWIKRWEWD